MYIIIAPKLSIMQKVECHMLTRLPCAVLTVSCSTTSLGPRPKTNPSADRIQYRARGRKGLVDIVHIPKDSLPLIQTC